MSDPLNASTPSPNEVEPDAGAPEDPATLQSAQDLDEDELGADPLEAGAEPAESWSEVAADRPTPREQREGGTLDGRLAAERSDRPNEPADQEPLTDSPLRELDETVDERAQAEVADGTASEAAAAEQNENAHGAVLQGDQVEATGLSATTDEGDVTGEDAREPGGAPEEQAERVEDSGF
ncbi:hypothetical protein [Parasphingorhabdus pacifica]